VTCITTAIVGGSTATFSSCIIAGGDAIVCNNNIKTFSNTYGSTGLIRMYGTDGNEKYQQGLTTNGDFYQYTFSGLNHIFYTNGGNERMRISSTGNVSVGRCDDMYRLNVFNDVPKTCTTARGLAFFGSNDALASAPFGLVITAQGGATISNRVVRIGTTDFGSANGGLLELNGNLFVCSQGNVGIGCSSPGYALDIRDGTTGSAGGRGMRLSVCSTSAGPQFRLEYNCTGDARNWMIGTNQEAAGDFILRSSTVAGCDPGGACSATRFLISKEGYVGIGTNVPTLQMHIHSATGDYNTMFSTSCVCGRAGWVIARPGSTTAIASALVLASDCSYRLGGGSYYNIKMMQDGSTSLLSTSEGEALKVLPGGITLVNSSSTLNSSTHQFQVNGRAHFSSYYAGLELYSTAWGASTYFQNAVNTDVNDTGDYLSINNPSSKGFVFRQGSTQAVTITTAGDVYLGPGYGATNHRIDKPVSQGNNVLVVSGYNGSSNDTAIFYGVSGAGGNAANTAIWVATNTATGRSINAGGTINASGGDYAEYITKRSDTGCIAKGQIVGIDACKLLTDKWSLAQSFVVKSTDPSYVGGDGWSSHLGNKPQRTDDVSEEEFAPILAEFEAKLEEARNKVDRVAFSGQVPVIVSGSYNIGDYILPIEGPNDTIVGVSCNISCLTLPDYGRTVGRVWGTCLDKAWIAVKIG
jgi:hypothetical protein